VPEYNHNPNVEKYLNKYVRGLLIILGTISVLLGLIGIILPLLPTTPFLLLGAAIYAKSSDKFYNWLIENRLFGSYIKNYREGKGIPLRVKVFAISFLWITILITAIFFVPVLVIKILLIVIAIAVTTHISALPGYH